MKQVAERLARGAMVLLVTSATASMARAVELDEDFESYSLTATNGAGFTDQNHQWTVPNQVASAAVNIIQDEVDGDLTQVLQVQRVAAEGGNISVRTTAFDSLSGNVQFNLDVLAESTSGLRVIIAQDDNIHRRGLDIDFSSKGTIRALSNGSFVSLKDAQGKRATYAENQWYRISAVIRTDDPDPSFDVTVTTLDADGSLIGTLSDEPTGGSQGHPSNIGLVHLQTPETARFDNVAYQASRPTGETDADR